MGGDSDLFLANQRPRLAASDPDSANGGAALSPVGKSRRVRKKRDSSARPSQGNIWCFYGILRDLITLFLNIVFYFTPKSLCLINKNIQMFHKNNILSV